MKQTVYSLFFVCVYMQLCELVNHQRYSKALSSNQRTLLVEKSRLDPTKRMEALRKVDFILFYMIHFCFWYLYVYSIHDLYPFVRALFFYLSGHRQFTFLFNRIVLFTNNKKKYKILTQLSSLQEIRRNSYKNISMLKKIGISITTQFTKVGRRILPAPSVNRKFSIYSCNFIEIVSSSLRSWLHFCCLTAVEIRPWAGAQSYRWMLELEQSGAVFLVRLTFYFDLQTSW